MSSDSRDLQTILVAQEKRDLAPNVSSQVINEMKSSLIFQISWEQLLQAAPTAISCMGACFIASSSPRAVVELTSPPGKGFQYLKYTSVQANLVECGNMGRMAFLEAENGMGVIQLTSQVINGKINEIVPTIADPVSAKKMLRPQLETLKSGANTCLNSAIAMDKNNEINLVAEGSRLDYQKSTVEEAKKAHEELGKQVGVASEAFKKASDEFPTGWDLLGQQIVGDLPGAVTTALNAAIPALLDNLNPMAKLKTGASIVGGFVNPPKGSNASAEGSFGTSNGASNTSQSATPPRPVPRQVTDPAFPEIQKISAYLSSLQVIVNGKQDGDIDWEMARTGSAGKSGPKSAIKFILTMLGDSKDRFTPLATSEEPSRTLSEILKVCLRVAAELQEEVEKSKTVMSQWPAKDSEQVNKWQSDFTDAYGKANTLLATAKTVPGTAANGVSFDPDQCNYFKSTGVIPLMPAQDPAVQAAQINAKTAQAQAVLESAKNRLATTSQMLTTAQDNYIKTTDMLLQQQNKLADIQATLAKLTASNVELAEIKRILIECIKLILNLKDQITNLVRFFRGIASIVEVCVKYHVEPFIATVKAITSDGDDPNEAYKVGDYTFTDFQRSQVYSAAVTLRSYFGVFGDIAKMWVTLSKDNVLPGLRMCDELSVTSDEKDPGIMQKKIHVLTQWSSDATTRVQQIAVEKQREIMEGMETRIVEVKETTAAIAAPPATILKAITAGTEVTKEAAQKSIEQRAKQSSLSRFAISDD
ncbi:hypothetical protein JX265_006459 [Neoarthrinium moseri]|uniref:Uncharacterized protein n=1 Tax=Neoarthrinium moseri TaxID=1658444 RepID=A0A9P9WLE6_9PEZI|nr:hypothetical protein JX265_006459 [Neoarthrinium moseri]